MTKNNKLFFSLIGIFLFIEIILGVFIQIIPSPHKLQYLSVALACIFCFLFVEKSKSYLFTQIALLCTVGADFFLIIVSPINQLVGMIFFSGTQIAYFLRIYFEQNNKKTRKIHLIARVIAIIITIAATFLVLGAKTDALALVSMFYYANLILNIVFAFANFKNSKILAIGLVCFAICDTFIGFANMGPYMGISENSLIYKLLNLNVDLSWLFYVPSQTLLAISLLPNKLKKRV